MTTPSRLKMSYLLLPALVGAGALAFFSQSGNATERAAAPQAAAEAYAPVTSPAPAQAPGNVVEGEVLEVLNVQGYTYLRLGEKGSAGTWTAVSSAEVSVGSRARVRSETQMTNFQSPTLKRTFETIHFGALDTGAPAAAAVPAVPAGHGSAAPAKEVKVGTVEKATGPNAYRIQEIFERRQELNGKTVRVRGVVVKRTAGVMGKTFVHLRDGSGKAESKNDDLTVTMAETPEVGQTLLVEGVATSDKDFGSGYQYDVLLEDVRGL